jgi:hypothetical protein
MACSRVKFTFHPISKIYVGNYLDFFKNREIWWISNHVGFTAVQDKRDKTQSTAVHSLEALQNILCIYPTDTGVYSF